MPKLAPSKKAADTINSISSLTADVAQSSFWVFLAIYLVISTAMKYVWATFNTLQIILVLPMLMVNVPVNVTNVQDSFKKIVNLDFIDKYKVYKAICEPLFGEIIETIKSPDTEIDYYYGSFVCGVGCDYDRTCCAQNFYQESKKQDSTQCIQIVRVKGYVQLCAEVRYPIVHDFLYYNIDRPKQDCKLGHGFRQTTLGYR